METEILLRFFVYFAGKYAKNKHIFSIQKIGVNSWISDFKRGLFCIKNGKV